MCRVNGTTCNDDKLILQFIVSPSVLPLTSQLWKSISLREECCLRYEQLQRSTEHLMQRTKRRLLATSFHLDDSKSRIYGKYKKNRQESSDRRTSYFVCCQDVVETSSPGPTDPVLRSARLRASVFGEVLPPKKKTANTLPTSEPLGD